MEFFVFVLFVWLFAEWMLRRHYQRKNDERFTNIVAALNRAERDFNELKKLPARIADLEKRLAEKEATAGSAATAPPPVAEPSAPPKPVAPVHAPAEPTRAPAPSAPDSSRITSVLPLEPPFVAAKTTLAGAEALKTTIPPQPPSPRPSSTPPAAPLPAPSSVFSQQQPQAVAHGAPASFASVNAKVPTLTTPLHTQRKSSEIEEKLGRNWLNKIGITVLVIGIALFLAYKFPTLSNPEKVLLGYFVSFGILGLGVYLEKKDLYKIFARALIGGGWALVFFTTYAMHFVKYTQVIDTEWVDLVLLFAVAAMMVAHTLRYNSQVVTGLAFLLAFTTVAISQNTVYCLAAGAILAIGLVAIVHRRAWFELEVFGLIASYLNHYIWLRTVIEPMGAYKHMFPEFVPSAVLLCLYWAIYRWSYIARKIQCDAQEHVSTLAALLNTGLLLALLKYQSVHPQLGFYVLLALGAVELTLGQLPATRKRRIAMVMLSTIGVILLVAAIPFKYSGTDMAIIWLIQAELLLFAGVFTREILFRRFGLLAALLTAGYTLIARAEPILETRLTIWNMNQPAESMLAVTFAFAAFFFYIDAHEIPRRWKQLVTSDFEQICFRGLSYLAGLMLFVSLWLAFPNAWTAVAWTAAAFALCIAGRLRKLDDLSHQASAFALAGFLWALRVNTNAATPFANTAMTLRLATLSIVIVLLYLCARWAGPAKARYTFVVSSLYTTAAAILVAVLAYYECHWAWIGVTWGIAAVVLAAAGIFWKRGDLSYQAHGLVLAGFVRTLVANIDATEEFHQFTWRFLTFAAMAALLYLCAYFSGPRESNVARAFSMVHTWAAACLIGVLAYKELSSSWIAVTWALFAMLLIVAGNRLKRAELHIQAYLLSFVAIAQVLIVNLYASEPFSWYPGVSLRLVTIGLTAALIYASGWFAAKSDLQTASIAGAAYTWGGSLLVSLLLLYELQRYNVALGWALFGLAAFEIGFFRKSFNWRLQGYLAFAAGFARIFVVNLEADRHRIMLTTLPLAIIFYYAYWRLQHEDDDFLATDRKAFAAPILAYLGTITVATVLESCLDGGWVAAGWAGLALVLIAAAWSAKREVFLHQSMLLALAVLVRSILFDLAQEWPPAAWYESRAMHVVTAAALLFAAQAFAFPLRDKEESHSDAMAFVIRRPEQTFFFIPLLMVTLLIGRDVAEGRVTMAWGIEAFVVFLFALLVGERSFRLTGLGLLLLCVGKILILDVWRQEKSDRFVTFIILGVALLLVSFLYTRYSEAIKRYL
jgi:hypothetical protein